MKHYLKVLVLCSLMVASCESRDELAKSTVVRICENGSIIWEDGYSNRTIVTSAGDKYPISTEANLKEICK